MTLLRVSDISWYFWGSKMRTIPAAGNGESYLAPVFQTIYKVGSIQISDMLMSDGYFRIFRTK